MLENGIEGHADLHLSAPLNPLTTPLLILNKIAMFLKILINFPII